jgi:hypothetical protein
MRLTFYKSRLFWGGLLGLGLLIWLWGYHLRMESSLVVKFPLAEGRRKRRLMRGNAIPLEPEIG